MKTKKIEIKWIEWVDRYNTYRVKETATENRLTKEPLKTIAEAKEYAKTYYGKWYNLILFIDGEMYGLKKFGQLSFHKLPYDFTEVQ